MPAQRLEGRVPEMKRKGRVPPGSDADLTVFDPGPIIDRSTYQQPSAYSEGVQFVLVAGVFVVKNGSLQQKLEVVPGRPIRAAVR